MNKSWGGTLSRTFRANCGASAFSSRTILRNKAPKKLHSFENYADFCRRHEHYTTVSHLNETFPHIPKVCADKLKGLCNCRNTKYSYSAYENKIIQDQRLKNEYLATKREVDLLKKIINQFETKLTKHLHTQNRYYQENVAFKIELAEQKKDVANIIGY